MARKPSTIGKTGKQKVPATQLVSATKNRKAGYVVTGSKSGAFHSYMHRDGSGPRHGIGSSDVTAAERAAHKNNPKTYFRPTDDNNVAAGGVGAKKGK